MYYQYTFFVCSPIRGFYCVVIAAADDYDAQYKAEMICRNNGTTILYGPYTD